ncbi:MAG: hypothetical protein KME46_33350 [Brasilonema angustatum HA4187-MV1]|jgi:hypothetical protein|nr:hypothetical protein [Brasilonema angustatum HA4187-MV1]
MINSSKIKFIGKNLHLPHYCYFDYEIKKEHAINQIRDMPELVMKHRYKILIDCPQDPIGQLFSKIKILYQYHAAWMDYYQGNNSILSNPNPRIQDYKSLADLSEATLKLCQEICLYTSWKSKESISPMHWFLSIEQQLCENLFANSGLTGTANPKGKLTLYTESLALDKSLEKSNSPLLEVNLCDLEPLEALEGLAYCIADNDTVFRNRQWLDYCRAVKRHYREMRNSKLNPVYLIDGEITRSGRGKDFR